MSSNQYLIVFGGVIAKTLGPMKNIFKSLFKLPHRPSTPPAPWIDELDHLDDISALHKTTNQLSHIAINEFSTFEERLENLLKVDEKNRKRVHNITQQYINFETLRADLAAKISETAYFYHRQIYASYRNLINSYLNAPNQTELRANINLLLARAMLAVAAMMKWRYYNQQTPPDNAWLELFSLYGMVEDLCDPTTTISPYDDEQETLLSKTFISTCMLGALDHGKLSRQQIEITSILLEKWLGPIKPSSSYSPQRHLFYIDLSKDSAAKRIRHMQPSPSCRFWEVDQVAAKVKLAITSVEDRKPLEYLDLGNLMHHEQIMDVLLMLKSEYSKNDYRRQRRSEERQRVSRSVNVTYGIEDICNKIKQQGLNAAGRPVDNYSLEDRLLNARSITRGAPNILNVDINRENWLIQDESTSGFGIIVSEAINPNVKVGKLVGLIIDNKRDNMVIGTIRSVKTLPDAKHHIGVKIISKQAKHVQLRVTTKQQVTRSLGEPTHTSAPHIYFSGLYISVEPSLTIWPGLILPRLKFVENMVYEIMHADKRIAVRLGVASEAKDDWVKVSWPE